MSPMPHDTASSSFVPRVASFRLSRMIASTIAIASSVAIAACGARGPLDDDGPLDAATDVVTVDTADAAPEPVDASLVDAHEAGSILGCGTCVVGQCSQGILACVQDAACQKTLQCVVTSCLSSGAPDAACLVKCASGDTAGALKIFTIFQCVTGTCGGDCGSLLSGALGGLGGSGGGTPPAPAPKSEARAMSPASPLASVLTERWPELGRPVAHTP